MAFNLLAVTVNDVHVVHHALPDTELVTVRDLAAICAMSEHRAMDVTEERVANHNEIVAAYASRGPVLPAPVGVVFKARDSVERWLVLHYGALSGALSFVENRVAARVHLYRPETPDERDAGTDLASVGAESLRVLRRLAVATLPLRLEKVSGLVLSAAFLVEEELWKDFVDAVTTQQEQTAAVRFELSGPWPPYDFVHMQLGS